MNSQMYFFVGKNHHGMMVYGMCPCVSYILCINRFIYKPLTMNFKFMNSFHFTTCFLQWLSVNVYV